MRLSCRGQQRSVRSAATAPPYDAPWACLVICEDKANCPPTSKSDDDIWIISTAAAKTLTTGLDVILLGGAQAKNIFWKGAVSAATGAYAYMAGIMLFFTDVLFVAG